MSRSADRGPTEEPNVGASGALRRYPPPKRKRNDWLIAHAANVTSQSGEDGIIERIFQVLPARRSPDALADNWCVEFGAWDGLHLSNTWALLNPSSHPSHQLNGSLPTAHCERDHRDSSADIGHSDATIASPSPSTGASFPVSQSSSVGPVPSSTSPSLSTVQLSSHSPLATVSAHCNTDDALLPAAAVADTSSSFAAMDTAAACASKLRSEPRNRETGHTNNGEEERVTSMDSAPYACQHAAPYACEHAQPRARVSRWGGVLVEADATRFGQLTARYSGRAEVECVCALVELEGDNSLDAILSRSLVPLPCDFDLLSIDVDGADYHVWESLQLYRPRVVVIEFNPTIPNHVFFVQPRDMRVQQGSSLLALTHLSRTKGYELVCTTTYNAFFVREEDYPLFGIPDNTLEYMHDVPMATELFQLYDGTLVITGCKKLLW